MGERALRHDQLERAMNARGWEIANRALDRADSMDRPYGFLESVAFVDELPTSDIACLVAALLGPDGAENVPVALRRAIANALTCWVVVKRRDG